MIVKFVRYNISEEIEAQAHQFDIDLSPVSTISEMQDTLDGADVIVLNSEDVSKEDLLRLKARKAAPGIVLLVNPPELSDALNNLGNGADIILSTSTTCEDLIAGILSAGRLVEDHRNRKSQLESFYTSYMGFVSHELKNPLVSLTGFVDLLATEKLGDMTIQQQKGINVIKRSTQRFKDVTYHYLDLLRIEQRIDANQYIVFNLHKDIIVPKISQLNEILSRLKLFLQLPNQYPNTTIKGYLEPLDGAITIILRFIISLITQGSTISVNYNVQIDKLNLIFTFPAEFIDKVDKDILLNTFYTVPDTWRTNLPISGAEFYIAKKVIKASHGTIDYFINDSGLCDLILTFECSM